MTVHTSRVRTAVIVSTKYVKPVDDGKKAVLLGFLNYLVDRLGRDNVWYVVIGRELPIEDSEVLCRTKWFRPPNRVRQVWSVLSRCLLCRQTSFQEALTFSPRLEAQLRHLILDLRPEVLLLDTIRVGQFFRGTEWKDTFRLLYMDDLFYLRFRSMLNTASRHPNARLEPGGTFANHLPGIARVAIRIQPVQRALLRMEMGAVERRELESPLYFDRCLLINPNEARVLRERTASNKVFSVKPVLFDRDAPVGRIFEGDPVFLLFGTLFNPAHRYSVVHFLDRCMGEIIKEIPEVRVRIIGSGADGKVRELAGRFPRHVELTGFVESIEDEMRSACALLVPLKFGGGLRLKTLTALYYGLPVITTEFGIDGLGLDDGDGFVREADLSKFATHMKRMLDRTLNARLSEMGRKAFERYYSKNAVFSEYDQLFGFEKPSARENRSAQPSRA